MTRKYYGAAEANRAIDRDDLMQCAYLAMCRAVQAYRPDEGAFTTVLGYHVRRECRLALRLDGREHCEIYGALSLDAPIGTDGDASTLADLVEDTTLPASTDNLEAQDKRREVRRAVDALPDQQAHIIKQSYYAGKTLQQIADDAGLSVATVHDAKTKAFRGLRSDKRLRQYMPDCYKHKGVIAFFSSQTSVVEETVIRIEEHRALLAQSLWANYHRYRH